MRGEDPSSGFSVQGSLDGMGACGPSGTLQQVDMSTALNLRTSPHPLPPAPASNTHLLALFASDEVGMVFNNATVWPPPNTEEACHPKITRKADRGKQISIQNHLFIAQSTKLSKRLEASDSHGTL